MKTLFCLLIAFAVFFPSQTFAQAETPPECLNLEEVQQKIGYPLEAKRAGASGKVIAKVTVGENGKVEKHEITDSPSPLLSQAVSDHIESLKFHPAKKEGKPIRSIVLVPIVFEAGGGDKVFTSLEEALTTTEVVEILDLSGQNLKTLDSRIARLTSLRKINLDDNSFTEIPSVLAKLPALAEIEMSGNQIKSVPGFLKKMKSLRSLDISNNQMSAAAITKAREMLEHVELLTD
jgi:TonB family protein